MVSGPAGSGKSRLLAEIGLLCARPVLAARAFQPQREEAWGLARSLLREVLALDLGSVRTLSDRAAQALADIVPELEELRPIRGGLVDPESRRALALEGAVRLVESVASKAPLIVADDLQWADATSLALMGLIGQRVPRIGIVVAYRPEEIMLESPAGSFLSEAAGLGGDLLTITLGPLPERAISELIADDDLARTILNETEATPFAVTEVLRALAARGAIEPEQQGRWRPRIPEASDLAREAARAGQRRAIQARVRRHSAKQRQTLSLLALLGREAPARVLATAKGEKQVRVLDDLEALARAGLVRLGDKGWATRHEVIGEIVAQGLDRSERGRLHEMLARALRTEGGDPSELARHLVGAGDPDAAADAFAEAAGQSLERFANDEAEHLSDAGLELAPRPLVHARLLEIRAEARDRKGNLSGAREDLRAALATKRAAPQRSRILTRIAMLTSGYEDYVRAGELVEIALTEAGRDAAARAHALAAGARLDMNLNRLERAEARAAEAVALFERIGDSHGVADILDTRANIKVHSGHLKEAVAMLDHVARLFQDAGKLLRVGTPRSNYGLGLMWMGRFEEGLSNIDEALDLERTLGHPEGEAYCLWLRSEGLALLGRVEEARKSAEEALSIARRLGHREWTAAALRGLGAACLSGGDLDGAEAAFRECLELAREMPIFSSLAASGLASVLIARGDLSSAERYVTQALTEGTAWTHYFARVARAELAVARADPDAYAITLEALALAEDGGDLVGAARLDELAGKARGAQERAAGPEISGLPRREQKTFMFTDVAGSTNLIEALGDEAWEHLLGWHDQTLRSLFSKFEGEEINKIGDGFFVAFERPLSAIECAVQIQRALAEHRFRHGFAPQVRIGLHRTEATRKERDYQGKGIHKAARIAAEAKGGEIVASASLADAARQFSVSEPRIVVLKGIAAPAALVSLDWR